MYDSKICRPMTNVSPARQVGLNTVQVGRVCACSFCVLLRCLVLTYVWEPPPPGMYSVLDAVWPQFRTTPSAVQAQTLCEPCPHGVFCSGAKGFSIEEGHWIREVDHQMLLSERTAVEDLDQNVSLVVHTCPAGACIEGGQCEVGHKGPLCSLCEEGYAITGVTCQPCRGLSGKKSLNVFIAVFVVVLAVILYYGAWRAYLFDHKKPTESEAEEEEGEQTRYQKCVGELEHRTDQLMLWWATTELTDYIKVFASPHARHTRNGVRC